MEIFVGAAVGLGFTEATNATKKSVTDLIKVFSSSACRKLRETLNRIKPTIDKMCELSGTGEESRSSSSSPSPSPFSSSLSSEAWLRSIQDFKRKLEDGFLLVEECEKTSVVKLHKKFRYAKKIQKLQNDIGDYIHTDIFLNMAQNVMILSKHQEIVGRQIIENSAAKVEKQDSSFCVPNTPSFLVGFDKFVWELRELVMDARVNVVGVTGMGGRGKSTLALALCHDRQVKEYFGSKVIYITVSEDPNLLHILKKMWEFLGGDSKSNFQNVDEAHDQLQLKISSRKNQPTLVVLDDVWSMSKLKRLLFQGEKYKTLVTTRDESTIPKDNRKIYKLPLLEKEHALSLFCHSAFGQKTIPKTHNEELVKKVQEGCTGLPLALKVIGSSLREQPELVWESALKKLSKGVVISKYHKEDLLERLKTSVDVLEDDEKQCFLDLAAFPQGRFISANALLDIWVNLHGMEWENAFVLLLELANRNLLELKMDSRSRDGISYCCVYGLSFSQHNVMRELALYLAEQDNKIRFRRLYLPPSKWQADRHQPSQAQIVSIHIGGKDDTQWPQIEFPEAHILILSITANEYCFDIPTVLNTMKKLKVLIIHNYGGLRAKLNALDSFKSLPQLKVLQLEGLIVPPLYDYCKFMESLEKISLSLCEGLGNMNGLNRDHFFNFPGLLEINVDHCSDLEELPTGICCLNFLKSLSVTNCHRLAKLPDELGNLGLLEVLRLCASPGLTALPTSICSLEKLKYLDISLCMSLYARGCSKLENILPTLDKLASLKYLICDKGNEQLFKKANPSINVEPVEDQFTLDWLLD